MACCAVLRCRALGLHGGARPRERRPDGLGAVLGYVGIDLRRAYIAMSEEFLHGADVMTLFEKVRCKGVAQRMGVHHLRDLRFPRGVSNRSLQDTLVNMMPADLS